MVGTIEIDGILLYQSPGRYQSSDQCVGRFQDMRRRQLRIELVSLKKKGPNGTQSQLCGEATAQCLESPLACGKESCSRHRC